MRPDEKHGRVWRKNGRSNPVDSRAYKRQSDTHQSLGIVQSVEQFLADGAEYQERMITQALDSMFFETEFWAA